MGNQKSIQNYESKSLLEGFQKFSQHLIAKHIMFEKGVNFINAHSTIHIKIDKNLKKCYYIVDISIDVNLRRDNVFLKIPMFDTTPKINANILKEYLISLYGPYVFICLRKFLKLDKNYEGIGKGLFKMIYNYSMATITGYVLEKLKEIKKLKDFNTNNSVELENILMLKKLKPANDFRIVGHYSYKMLE